MAVTFDPAGRPLRATDHARARQPLRSGVATGQDGVRIAWEEFGTGTPTIVLLPSAPIIHSRQWKAQVHYLSRHHRVVTYDGRGNGRSDRPVEAQAYADDRFVDDVRLVLDATETEQAVLVGLCSDSVWRAIRLAAEQHERVLGLVAFAVGVPKLTPPHPWRVQYSFDDVLPTDQGWAKQNRHFWRRDYPAFVEFFFSELASEPHSTKQIEDAVEWALEGSLEAMFGDSDAPFETTKEEIEAICRAVRCPMLLVHGTEDTCQPVSRAHRLAELTGAPLVLVEGADHMIPGRHPVLANLLIHEFASRWSDRRQP